MTVQHDHVHHSAFGVSPLPLFFAAALVLLVCAWTFVP